MFNKRARNYKNIPQEEVAIKTDEKLEEVKDERTLKFQIKLKNFDKDTSTPIIAKVTENGQNSYVVPKLEEDDEMEDTYLVETPVESDHAEVHVFVPPVNIDGSMYEIPEESIKKVANKENFDLKFIPKEEVTEEQIRKVLTDTKTALENGCNELTVNEKNKFLNKIIENVSNYDVKKAKTITEVEPIKETGKEAKKSSSLSETIKSNKDPVKELANNTQSKPLVEKKRKSL
ncbi:hypothetical protein [uncultured Anaerococcus sp.]|uniref:hypothetical protein n=1 Tax=uncultured Anaerococcus sp. TaxID=293428 RepID=UPI00288B148A|nr:hypothetical protein [uncultured Anaerococcus sp.]